MTIEQKLENITGNLRDAYKLIVPGTMRHVDELMRERRENIELRNQWFYTADGEVYSLENKTPTLWVTREATNPVLKNIEDAFEQLITKGNYLVTPADFEAVRNASDTVSIDLTQLGLQKDNKEYQHLKIDTSKKLGKYNAEQQKLLRRIYGPTDEDYTANMQVLRDSQLKIKETRIFVLNPNYVKANVKNNAVGRASWLSSFSLNSDFGANVRSVDYDGGCVRGVRREVVREAGALKNEEVPCAASAPQEIVLPSLYQVLTYSKKFVPEEAQEQFEAGLQKLYNL